MPTLRFVLLAALAACALAAPAYGAYPGIYGVQDGAVGALAPGGATLFVAAKSGAATKVSAVRPSTFAEVRFASIPGQYGIPAMLTAGVGLGMFHDGSAFVLQSVANQTSSSFAVVRTADLQVRDTIVLSGSYAFDALSPDGSRLYLIEHRSQDLQHYVVRAYDLAAHTLLPGRIADTKQKSWLMQGYPVARATTPTGRWVYTLYTNPGGFPFVHALDTVAGVAHCVGIGWKGSQNPLDRYRLALDGARLLVQRPSGTTYRSIDRRTWAVALK
jgi:hypothetical protein